MTLVAAAVVVLILVSVVFLAGYFVGGVIALRAHRAAMRGASHAR